MSPKSINLTIAIVAALLFIPFLGNVHLFDWDEINFAESAREMIVSGNYSRVQIDFKAFWEKPPLFFWLQVLSMKLFGINEFAARFPNAICGIITLLVLFNLGKRLYNATFGFWWMLIYAGSFLPHFYFKSGIIDPWFNLFIFCAIYFLTVFIYGYQKQQTLVKHLVLSAVFTGLGILTKGPVALLVVLLSYLVFLFFQRGKALVAIKYYLLYAIIVALISMLWFGYEIWNNGITFIKEFYEYQVRLLATEESGHGGPFYYHFVVLLIGAFPASLFIYRLRRSSAETTLQYNFRQIMQASLIVILVVFSIVQTKIVHYSSFAYFPISFLAAYTVYVVVKRYKRVKKWQKWMVGIIGYIWVLLGIALPLVGMNAERLIPFIEDEFAAGNLEAKVNWNYFHLIPGLFYFVAITTVLLRLKKATYEKAFRLLFFSTIIYIQCIAVIFVPKIEKYTQNAAIEFLVSLQGKDVYVETFGYKSYAQYYYSMRMPGHKPEASNVEWLLAEKTDKPTYIICRAYSLKDLQQAHGSKLKELYRKNGFIFFQKL